MSDCRTKHGAVLVGSNGDIISSGFNHEHGLNRHGTNFANNEITCHAERDALQNCPDRRLFYGASLYVVRVDVNTGAFLNSEPCNHCKEIIENYSSKWKLQKIYFTNN